MVMDILVNKTSRAISVDRLLLIPGQAYYVDSAKDLSNLYPRFAQMLNSGDIVLQKPVKKTEIAEPVEEKVAEPVEEKVAEPVEEKVADTLHTDAPAENTEELIANRRQNLRRKKG